ncbi:murein L,D-transpeptidase, partial [Clostridium perfringens]
MDGNALKKYKSLNYTNFNSDMDSFVNSNNLES